MSEKSKALSEQDFLEVAREVLLGANPPASLTDAFARLKDAVRTGKKPGELSAEEGQEGKKAGEPEKAHEAGHKKAGEAEKGHGHK